MKEVSELRARQIRLFPADRIPFAAVRTAPGQKTLNDLFSWSDVGMNPATGELVCSHGVYTGSDQPATVIHSLQMSERRILLEVGGDTDQANLVFAALAAALTEHDRTGMWKSTEPIVLTHETACVVTLNSEWTRFLSEPLLGFVRESLEVLSDNSATAEISGLKFAVLVSYIVKDKEIREHGITLAAKTLTIEPRTNTPLSERRYFTSSPTDTSTHLELLRRLEAVLTGSGSEAESVPRRDRKRRRTGRRVRVLRRSS